METKERTLTDLQLRQLSHDKVYHPDIYNLPPQHKLRHYVLHYAKYVGRIVEAGERNDVDLFKLTMIDTFIITLAAANLVGAKMFFITEKGGELHPDDSTLKNVIDAIDMPPEEQLTFFNKENRLLECDGYHDVAHLMAIVTGELASAVEKLDHMENGLADNKLLISKLSKLLSTCARAFAFLGNSDPSEYIVARWGAIERNSIFYEHFNSKNSIEPED